MLSSVTIISIIILMLSTVTIISFIILMLSTVTIISFIILMFQGPPGTGKTSAILGIVSALLSRSYDIPPTSSSSSSSSSSSTSSIPPSSSSSSSSSTSSSLTLADQASNILWPIESQITVKSIIPPLSLSLTSSQLSQLDSMNTSTTLTDINRNNSNNSSTYNIPSACAFTNANTDTDTNTSASTTTLIPCTKRQRILLCAPSNAAIDELLLRLLKGVWNKHGVPSVVKV